ncbi:hypothetical protein EBR66_03715 [bacterium]|nr:hypothetical protein [bacterium]
MSLFRKSVLALALVAAPTMAFAQPATEARFIRIEQNAKQEPIALQTAIAKYTKTVGGRTIEVDLVGVIHVGEKQYYDRLNVVLKDYQRVLYELVAPKGTRPEKGAKLEFGDPLAMLRESMKESLKIDDQRLIDYSPASFVHADLSFEGIIAAAQNRGENAWTFALGLFKDFMIASNRQRSLQRPEISEEDMKDPLKMRRIVAQQFADSGGESMFGETLDASIVKDRNIECMSVLQKELAAGHTKLAIFYGAGHNEDFDKRLKSLGFTRVGTDWLSVWSLVEVTKN